MYVQLKNHVKICYNYVKLIIPDLINIVSK